MKHRCAEIFWIFICVGLITAFTGCRWQDDFRRQRQPLYGELEPKPTFNADSKFYVGDEIAIDDIDEREIDRPDVPTIDDLSEIPPVPEYPVGR